MPAHVAIIMDGNGRWATSRGLSRYHGHKKGAEAVRNCVDNAKEAGVKYLTLFAFSSENWKRPQDEVSGLISLLRYYMKRETSEMQKSGIRLRVIGDLTRFDADIRDMISQAENVTAENNDLVLVIALNYGGRMDITHAAQKLAKEVLNGVLNPDLITEDTLGQNLMTADFPDPDLVIRTSEETRLSNFLMWQLSYTEIYFTSVLWPDFSKEDLTEALKFYQKRDRRFGGLSGECDDDSQKRPSRQGR